MAMIEIIDVHKSFGSLDVLRGVNLTVEKGESMTVIGGSGSGKSVLIKHVIGLLFPDKGRVIVDGQVLNGLDEFGLNELRKKFGMLFQLSALFDSLTVWENVGFSLKQHTKLSDKEIRKIVTQKLALVGLIGCYKGFHTEGGAEGVGKATTGAVVVSCMLILILDYFLSALLW